LIISEKVPVIKRSWQANKSRDKCERDFVMTARSCMFHLEFNSISTDLRCMLVGEVHHHLIDTALRICSEV
jgi:hypothetical protein